MKKGTKIKRVTKRANPITKQKPYTATIKVLGKFFVAKGPSVSEAISNLKVKNVRGVSILTIERDKKKKERILPFFTASRLFNLSGTTRQIALKNVVKMFDI